MPKVIEYFVFFMENKKKITNKYSVDLHFSRFSSIILKKAQITATAERLFFYSKI